MIDLYPAVHPGCTDANCLFRDNSKGMHTNGGCNCERDLSRGNPTGREAGRLIRILRAEATRARASEMELKAEVLEFACDERCAITAVAGNATRMLAIERVAELDARIKQLEAELSGGGS